MKCYSRNLHASSSALNRKQREFLSRSTWRQKSDGLIWLGHAEQNLEQQQPALEVYGDKKILFGVLTSVLAELRGELRMRKQISDLVGTAFNRMHQHTS